MGYRHPSQSKYKIQKYKKKYKKKSSPLQFREKNGVRGYRHPSQSKYKIQKYKKIQKNTKNRAVLCNLERKMGSEGIATPANQNTKKYKKIQKIEQSSAI